MRKARDTFNLGRRCVLCHRPLPDQRAFEYCCGERPRPPQLPTMVQIPIAPGVWDLVDLERTLVLMDGTRRHYGHGEMVTEVVWDEIPTTAGGRRQL